MGPFLLENAAPKENADPDVLSAPPSEPVTGIKNESIFSDIMGGDVLGADRRIQAGDSMSSRAVDEDWDPGSTEADEASGGDRAGPRGGGSVVDDPRQDDTVSDLTCYD